jgi:hypothetical protein
MKPQFTLDRRELRLFMLYLERKRAPPRPVFISDEAADLFISFYISDL